jgi:hypothetical protein
VPITINNVVIPVETFTEQETVVAIEWVRWLNSGGTAGIVRSQKKLGTYLTWNMSGAESVANAPWPSSVMGSLKALGMGTVSGTLIFSMGDVYAGTYEVYLSDFSWSPKGRSREFTMELGQTRT